MLFTGGCVRRHSTIPDWIIIAALVYTGVAILLLSGKLILFFVEFIRGFYGIA
jgi:hypothetical protein